uniref:Uncharacterized protein n=1 Tax=Tetradesmus obliquus TaxID=3088 RepID=A0A383VXH2_TETOB|eukprot:jgi/Sobl393_1/6036/SZX69630.1
MASKAVCVCLVALIAGACIAEAARVGPMASADNVQTAPAKPLESATRTTMSLPPAQPHLHPIDAGVHPSTDLWRQPWFKGDVWRPQGWPHNGAADDSAAAGDAGVSTSWRR